MISFFSTPARIQALAIGALAITVMLLAAVAYGLWWRGSALEARGERDVAQAQVAVLADSVKVCSASIDVAKQASDRAMAFGEAALAEMRKRNAPFTAQIAKLEDLLKQPPPPDANCDKAWAQIEKNAAAGSQR